jgi:biotin operon repressor
MNMLNQLALLQRMDDLINRKGTGTAEELADRLDICRRSVFNYFERLRYYGAEIEFNFEKNSYFYVDDKRPSLPIIAKQNANRLNGGNNFNNFFLGVQVFCTPALDLCPKLIHNEEQDEASRYRFSEWGY